jgi:plastocyanin
MKLITTLVVAAVALALAATASSMSPAKLTGTVGPGFTITLKKAGKAVKTLKAGKYTFVVTDKASIHNFEIEGPGVDKEITGVSFKGTKSVTITLKKGSYKFYCAPHESSMNGKFKVT